MTSFIIDRLGQIAEANPAAERLFRYQKNAFMKKRDNRLRRNIATAEKLQINCHSDR
jgi:PAS domain-containing protein